MLKVDILVNVPLPFSSHDASHPMTVSHKHINRKSVSLTHLSFFLLLRVAMEIHQNQKNSHMWGEKSLLGYEVLQEPEKMWVYTLETTTASRWDVNVGSEIHLLMIISKVRQWKKQNHSVFHYLSLYFG